MKMIQVWQRQCHIEIGINQVLSQIQECWELICAQAACVSTAHNPSSRPKPGLDTLLTWATWPLLAQTKDHVTTRLVIAYAHWQVILWCLGDITVTIIARYTLMMKLTGLLAQLVVVFWVKGHGFNYCSELTFLCIEWMLDSCSILISCHYF